MELRELDADTLLLLLLLRLLMPPFGVPQMPPQWRLFDVLIVTGAKDLACTLNCSLQLELISMNSSNNKLDADTIRAAAQYIYLDPVDDIIMRSSDSLNQCFCSAPAR